MSQLSLMCPSCDWGSIDFNVELSKKLYEKAAEARTRERFNAAKKLKEDSLKWYQKRALEIDTAEEFNKMEFELLKNPKTYLPLESMESLCNDHEALRKQSSERVMHLMGLNDNETESIYSIDPIYDCLVEDPNLLTWLKFAKLGIMEDDNRSINIDWIEDDSCSNVEVLSFECLWDDWSSSWGPGWALECSTVSDYAWDNWDDWCEVKVRTDAFFERRMRKAEKRRFNRERFYLDWLFGERKSRGRSNKDSSSSDESLVGFAAHRPKSQRMKEAFYAPLKWLQPKLEKLKAKSLRSSLFQRSPGKCNPASEGLVADNLKEVYGRMSSDELCSELGGLDSGEMGLTPELGPCEAGCGMKCVTL